MTQRDSTGIKTKTSVELVDDLRAADLSDLCDAAELAITDGGGFGWLVTVFTPKNNLLSETIFR